MKKRERARLSAEDSESDIPVKHRAMQRGVKRPISILESGDKRKKE